VTAVNLFSVDLSTWEGATGERLRGPLREIDADFSNFEEAILAGLGILARGEVLLAVVHASGHRGRHALPPAVARRLAANGSDIDLALYYEDSDGCFAARVPLEELSNELKRVPREMVLVLDLSGTPSRTREVSPEIDVQALLEETLSGLKGHGQIVELRVHASEGRRFWLGQWMLERLADAEAELVIVTTPVGPTRRDSEGIWRVATPVPHACEPLAYDLESWSDVMYLSAEKRYAWRESGVTLTSCPRCGADLRSDGVTAAAFVPTIAVES